MNTGTETYTEPTYDTKTTNIAGYYHCRLFRDGKLVSEIRCSFKEDIGWCFREMLRWQDKLGFISKFASAARERQMETPNPKGKYIWIV